MGWREDSIAKYRKDIEQMRESIEWLRSGKLEQGEVLPGGAIDKTSRREASIAHYERIIPELEGLIRELEGMA